MSSDTIPVRCHVIDSLEKKPVVFASAALTDISGQVIQVVQTDEEGNCIFYLWPGKDTFRLRIHYIGHKPLEIGLSRSYPGEQLVLELAPDNIEMEGVTITAARPVIRYDGGKLTMSVANTSLSAGSNMLDILQKAPGVSVGIDGGLVFRGRQGLLVLVDNKNIYVTGAELARYLETMSAAEVEKIEIIANPSARYDAAGNVGIINIVTKKSREYGWNGSMQMGGAYGDYFRPNAALQLNFRPTQSLLLYGRYNFSGGKTLTLNSSERLVSLGSDALRFDQSGDRVARRPDHRARLGLDYEKGRHFFSVLLNAFDARGFSDGFSRTEISFLQPDSIVEFTNNSTSAWQNLSLNANHQFRIDTNGRLLDINLDYAGFGYESTDNMASLFYLPNGGEYKPAEKLRNQSPSAVQILAGKVDYTHPFGPGHYIQTGAKASYA